MAQLKASLRTSGEFARVFLAICPPRPIRATLIRYQNACTWNRDAVLVSPVKFHITLYFLGRVERQLLTGIGHFLKTDFAPFRITLDRPELWKGGIAVLRPSKVPRELRTLQTSLSKRVHSLGLRSEPRKLRPHLTLAGHTAAAFWPKQTPKLVWPVENYALLESDLGAPGTYIELRTYAHDG